MLFNIHASGSLGNVPDLGKKAYRLHCRFHVHALHGWRELELAQRRAAEWFIDDLYKEGWHYVERFSFKRTGPFPHIMPMNLSRLPMPSAREMLPAIRQGARFRDGGGGVAPVLPPLMENEYWDYDICGVFIRPTILMDMPDIHEERA